MINANHPKNLRRLLLKQEIRIATYALFFVLGLSRMAISQGTQGLDVKKRLSQYVLRGWNTEDGLTSESVSQLVQTDDGYIWFGTYTGLHRFDGKDFTIYNSQNSPLPSSNILKIEKGKDDLLWIGTLNGLITYKDGKFEIPKSLTLRDYSVEDLHVTKEGAVWFSTKANQLYFYDLDSLYEYTDKFNVRKNTVLSIGEDESGSIYFGTDDSRFFTYSKDQKISETQLPSEINGVNTILAGKRHVFLGTGRGLFQWDGESLVKNTILYNRAVNCIQIDKNYTIWIGTMRGLYRYQTTTDRIDSLTEENGLPNNIIQDLLFDDQGNLWVGTYRKGIFFLSDGSITSYAKNDGLATNIITGITELREDVFLLGNENGKLNIIEDEEVSEFTPPIPIPTDRLKNLFTDSKGRVWISTYGGLVLLDGKNSRHYNTTNGFPDNFTRLAFEDKDGVIWLGTKNAGLIIFSNPDQWTELTVDDGLSSNYILSIEEKKNGDLVVGTISGMNIIRDRKVIKTVTVEDGLPSNFMFTTHTSGNYTWIASNDGLTGYSEDKIVNFNTENGLPTNIIYDLLEDENGNLWIPSENAILSVKISELESLAASGDGILTVKQYDKSYGMKNSHCLGAVLSYEDSKGRFWIPTIGGIARLDPDEINTPEVEPSLILENITADNKQIPLSENVLIPSGSNRLQIDFTGISYKQSALIQFRYKLSPFDSDWIRASSDRVGIYTNLSPGTYEFQLQAGLDNQFFNDTLIQKITIDAAWWQTLWAKVLFGLVILLIALLIYWIRLRSLTANNLKLESTVKERTSELELQKQELRVAIDQLKNAQDQMIQSDKMASLGILAAGVAHEINNPLNFIQGGVDGLEQAVKQEDEEKRASYNVLLGAIKEGIVRASTIVQSLNEFSHSSNEKKEDCDIHHIINNALNMIRYRLNDGIQIKKEFVNGKVKITGNSGRLHQAFLNIITNSIQAIEKEGTISINTSIEGKKLLVSITDTGEGIKPENLKKITEPFFSTKDPGKGTGLGLSITYSIFKEHNGSIDYESEWGKGTTAKITLPLS